MSEKITFGEKAAERCAKIFASWKFGICSLAILNAWAILNSMHIIHYDPDLAFANFNLSQLTYFVDLVLMMNAVRQALMDRQKLAAILSLEKTIAKELAALHKKLDQILGDK